jgi:hypothetical protein
MGICEEDPEKEGKPLLELQQSTRTSQRADSTKLHGYFARLGIGRQEYSSKKRKEENVITISQGRYNNRKGTPFWIPEH